MRTDTIDRLRNLIEFLPDNKLRLCQGVTHNLRWLNAPGGVTRHHQYRGGLADHTADVVEHAQQMASDQRELEVVTVAGIFHDFAKIYEYEFVEDEKSASMESIIATPYRDLIRHVAGSYHRFMVAATHHDIDEGFKLDVGHCILAHHGRKEWGSPVEPVTRAAHILHVADMLSMKANDTGGRK